MVGKQVKAQLHASSDRHSKILKDLEHIEATVEVEGVGTLVLNVGCGGEYTLRGYPKGDETSGLDLLVVGVMHPEGIEAIHPNGAPATEG